MYPYTNVDGPPLSMAVALAKERRVRLAMLLPVSAPFHSSLMLPAAEKLKERLESIDFAPLHVALFNNIDVAVESDADKLRDALYRQAFGPVRWVECVQAIKARGVSHLVECGPGKVLAGLTKRIDPELIGLALYDPASLQDVQGQLA